MRKLTRIIAIVVLAVVSLFYVGCSFIDESGNFPSGEITNSKLLAENVTIYSQTGVNPQVYDIETEILNAIKKVERTAVALSIVSPTGTVGAGSGVILDIEDSVDTDVYIITCHHMVAGLGDLTLFIPDEDCSYENEDYMFTGVIDNQMHPDKAVNLVGGDKESDIAVLKLDLTKPAVSGETLLKDEIVKAKIPAVEYSVKKGETVFSIGNPTGGLPGTVSRGIVSYLNRTVSVDEVGNMSLMQIDVSTNPGNSGGGLYNVAGDLIGITNAGNTNYTNINFAIPCELKNENGFVEIAEQLYATYKNSGEKNHGYVSGHKEKFGFTVTKETDNGGKTYVFVQSVASNSLSAIAGLKTNDIITSITVNGVETVLVDDQTSNAYEKFISVMDNVKIGDVLVFKGTRQEAYGTMFNIRYREVEFNNVSMTAKQFWFCDTGK